ncbi:MAG: class C sortase [Lachnospiraceae bacterium]|nr:class C sortase [Lachnospiraceae bacterium]
MQQNKSFNYMNLLLVLVFIAGLAILLYPNISDYVNQMNSSKAVSEYDETLAEMTAAERSEMMMVADTYNTSLSTNQSRFVDMTNDELKEYNRTLNVGGDGMMCYLKIDKLGVNLPVYHGTTEEVLQKYVGHIEGTSLPTGGIGTHCGLSGHRGLPSAVLFTNLDRMEVGDEFSIFVLGEEHVYVVDQISTVLPSDMSPLAIDSTKDFCTLVTCTPYGVNTHRLMVRGVRVGDDGNKEGLIDTDDSESSSSSRGMTREQIVNAIAVGMTGLFGLIIIPFILVAPPTKRKNLILRPWDDKIVEVIDAATVVSNSATRANWEVADVARESDWLAGLRQWNENMVGPVGTYEAEEKDLSYEQVVSEGNYEERDWDDYRYEDGLDNLNLDFQYQVSQAPSGKLSEEKDRNERDERPWDDDILQKVDQEWGKLDGPAHKIAIQFIEIKKILEERTYGKKKS